MVDKEKKEATARPIEAFSETNQTLAESLATAHERNLKYAQSVFVSTITLLKDHVESTRSLLEQWEQQAQKQPVVPGAAANSFSFFRAPLTAYQQVIEVVGTASKQSLENFQKAGESFEKAMQQGREQWEEAARRTAHSTEKPGK
ncbi:MAG: hypothetical protein ACXVBU_06815 [Ktedonobacteraceae bacterium]